MNMLFFIVFMLFSVLIFRLGYVQIVHGDDYRREQERTEDVTVSNTVPRGKMLDRNLKPIVDNSQMETITFTRFQNTKQEEMIETAEKLAQLIDMSESKVTERDKKDFWILLNGKKAKKKITDAEQKKFKDGDLEDKDLYKLQLDRITEEELEQDLTADDLEVLAIYREMAAAKSLTPVKIKSNGVTAEEVARVSENLENLPGIDVMTDWERDYLFGSTLSSVLGKVTSSDEGIPAEKLKHYQSKGYSNNDRIGVSYLEMEYEDVLRGEKAKVKNITDKSGAILETIPVTEGKSGNDLILSFDMDLQIAVEEIIEKQLKEKKRFGNTYLLDRAYVVLMDPNTGEVLSMAGKQYVVEDGKVKIMDHALGNITSAFTMGSVVKGATVLAGLDTGVNTPATSYYDTPMNLRGGVTKSSWKPLGTVDARRALEQSSNIYMYHTAIKLGGTNYVRNGGLSYNIPELFETMRYYYSQFGLGIRTGIDLPNEMVGFKGPNPDNPGLALDMAIGQYDMYTPMQLAQYVSTIANGGKRVQPRVVKEIREPSNDPETLGAIKQEFGPRVYNTLSMKDSDIQVAQEGFRRVMTRGTASGKFSGKKYNPAGKTGTAQAFYDGPKEGYRMAETTNTTLVAYAPSEKPEVAMSVVVPWAYQGNSHYMAQDIGEAVLDTYFKLKEKRIEKSDEDLSEEEGTE
ncbi:MAG: peptidoglycan D,D-transpeptidase FtsI family protein [Bacillus sp. (in: firmicutes)]